MTLAKRLRELRESKGMTREDLSGAKVSESYIKKLERGERTNPTLRTLNILMIRLDEPFVKICDEPIFRGPP